MFLSTIYIFIFYSFFLYEGYFSFFFFLFKNAVFGVPKTTAVCYSVNNIIAVGSDMDGFWAFTNASRLLPSAFARVLFFFFFAPTPPLFCPRRCSSLSCFDRWGGGNANGIPGIRRGCVLGDRGGQMNGWVDWRTQMAKTCWWTKQLSETFAGRKILLGVDRLDYIKGMPHKVGFGFWFFGTAVW